MKTNKIFALLIIFAFVASIVPITQVKAQTAPTMKTYAVVDAIPNPVGVGQDVLVKFGILTAIRNRRFRLDRFDRDSRLS